LRSFFSAPAPHSNRPATAPHRQARARKLDPACLRTTQHGNSTAPQNNLARARETRARWNCNRTWLVSSRDAITVLLRVLSIVSPEMVLVLAPVGVLSITVSVA